jgi:phospholipid transport system substrate-binding protein
MMKTQSNRVATLALFGALTLFAPLLAPFSAQANDEAIAMVRQTSDSVLLILRDEATDSATKKERLEALLTEHADFPTISKLVMARNWKLLSAEEQTEFSLLFRKYLTATYGRNVDSYSDETVKITGSRDEARGDVTVQSKVMRSGDDILVDYRLRQFDGKWRIIDVVAERISMVSNLRSQFQEVVSQGGTKKLIALLREKSETGGDDVLGTAATK